MRIRTVRVKDGVDGGFRSGCPPGRTSRGNSGPVETGHTRIKRVQSTPDAGASFAMETEKCPSCGEAVSPDSRGGLRCGGCGAVVAEPLALCPRCRHINESGSGACARCAAELSVQCSGCGRTNWTGIERCIGCGRELDSLGHAFRPFGRSVQIRRDDLLRRVPGLREKEESESRQRLEMLRDADRRRLEREAERVEKAELRKHRIILGAGSAVVVFFILVVLAVVFFR
jgi:hypothetical protein